MQVYNQSSSGSVYTRVNRLPELKKSLSLQLEPAQDVYFGASRLGILRGMEKAFSTSSGGDKPPEKPGKKLERSHEVGEESQGAGSQGVIRARRSESPLYEEYVAKKKGPGRHRKRVEHLTPRGRETRREAIRKENPGATAEQLKQLYEADGVAKQKPGKKKKPGEDLTRDSKQTRRSRIREKNPNVQGSELEALYEADGVPSSNRYRHTHGGRGPTGIEAWAQQTNPFEQLQSQPAEGYGAEYVNAPDSQTSSARRFNMPELAKGLESNSSRVEIASQAKQYPIQESPTYNPGSPISYTPPGQEPVYTLQSPQLPSGGVQSQSPTFTPDSPTVGFTSSPPSFQPPSPTTLYPFSLEGRTPDFIRRFLRHFNRIPNPSDYPAVARPWTPVYPNGDIAYERTNQRYTRASNGETGHLYTYTDPETGIPEFYARTGNLNVENDRLIEMEPFNRAEHLMHINPRHRR